MESCEFCIHFQIRANTGLETFGKFMIGTDAPAAYDLFGMMKGSTDVGEDAVLVAEFVEFRNELPANVKLISCSLDELAENCRIIARETFKRNALEGHG